MSEEDIRSVADKIKLEPHAFGGRTKAVAVAHLSAGSLLVACEAFATVLLPEEKGRRCDYCHRRRSALQKCSACAGYFYCDATCQTLHWGSHKKICKRFNNYTSSIAFQALAAHEKLDALLLSHLVARLDAAEDPDIASPITSLLPGPAELPCPPIMYSSPRVGVPAVRLMHARFGNNNFVLHSHLNTFGHGIFPLASRLFNHGCLPNAAAKYVLLPAHPPRMEVVALRDIGPGDEICLPYLDPALVQSRQQIFELSYGFKCRCPSCVFFEGVAPIPDPPSDAPQKHALAQKLVQFTKAGGACDDHALALTAMSPGAKLAFPRELLPVFHEAYISFLSETFRNASHDGVYELALSSGEALLAVYRLVYPPNYPQIGLHLLELAKTAWNRLVSEEDAASADRAVERAKREGVRAYLAEANRVLQIFGREGDEDGPLVEVDTLETLLREA
ncbi:hypothetical protein C8J57DRAFT_1279819 [Mycena rebaudengoi]|nr:hypothetical protein C8J57DRAFT_1279819 [Mycena rebaudengoi]